MAIPTTVLTPVIEAFGDADEVGPGLGYAQPHDMASKDEQNSEMEERAAQPEHPALVEL
jgi:hypothetical protein